MVVSTKGSGPTNFKFRSNSTLPTPSHNQLIRTLPIPRSFTRLVPALLHEALPLSSSDSIVCPLCKFTSAIGNDGPHCPFLSGFLPYVRALLRRRLMQDLPHQGPPSTSYEHVLPSNSSSYRLPPPRASHLPHNFHLPLPHRHLPDVGENPVAACT